MNLQGDQLNMAVYFRQAVAFFKAGEPIPALILKNIKVTSMLLFNNAISYIALGGINVIKKST